MNNKQIVNLSTLRHRKEQVRLEMRVTRQAMQRSIRQTGRSTQRLVINGFLIPLGLGSLATLIFDKDSTAGAEKPSWLVVLEQAVRTINRFYDPEAPTTAPSASDQDTPQG